MTSVPLTDRYIIAARLKGYLAKPQDGIDLLTEALAGHPDDVRLLRFRGHRRISVRDYAGAVADLSRAAELLHTIEDGHELYQNQVEKDIDRLLLGRDDEVRVQHLPLSAAADDPDRELYMTTLHTSVWYHLGVALYLDGRMAEALDAFVQAEATSYDVEGGVASLDWQYMILRRLGRDDEAAQVLERFRAVESPEAPFEIGYLNRMRLYSGQMTADELRAAISDNPLELATQGYGLGNWLLYNGRPDEAREVFEGVIGTGARYAFAYLAAENELAAMAA